MLFSVNQRPTETRTRFRQGRLREMQSMARSRGGRCLSARYANAQTKLLWQCGKGHKWRAVPNSIQQGTWCPYCAGRARGSIQEMRQLARSRGGRCLSSGYRGRFVKLRWRCGKGHEWDATPDSLLNAGSWCPHCAGRMRLDLREMKALARKRGGKCLSKEYVNSDTPLVWQCARGHTWRTRPYHVKAGHWCKRCAAMDKWPARLDRMRRLAEKRGGKCLSKQYQGPDLKLEWECAQGHRWLATPEVIQAGIWCPHCAGGISEEMCRVYFEHIFGRRFPKGRPGWLRSESGNQMELDGYCESLRLAFEHHGTQHSKRIAHFERARTLEQQKDADKRKRNLCRRHGVTLIEIPALFKSTRLADLGAHILKECRQKRTDLPIRRTTFANVDTSRAYTSNAARKLEECRDVARSHAGLCVSQTYVNAWHKLTWQCSKGHTWRALPGNVLRGSWCPECGHKFRGDKQRLTIAAMQIEARKRGGKCLSTEYVDCEAKLRWHCAHGHEWEAIPNSVRRGSWCPVCARKQAWASGRARCRK